MAKLPLLATISLMANVIAFFSIVSNIYVTHQTQSYTWFSLFVNFAAQILLIIYGLANKAPEIYGPTILLIFGLSYIIYDKYTYAEKIIKTEIKEIEHLK
jgi:hypothetical protein